MRCHIESKDVLTLLQVIAVFVDIFCLAFAAVDRRTNTGVQNTTRPHQVWADAAYQYVRTINCSTTLIVTSRIECEEIRRRAKSTFTLHVAPPDQGKFHMILPDRRWRARGRHDAVVALDPYPGRMFGHLILLFHLDRSLTRTQCQLDDGLYLEDNFCMRLSVKRECRHYRYEGVHVRNLHRICEVHFLPVVQIPSLDRGTATQRLNCRDDAEGFASCPQTRNTTANILPNACNPHLTNRPSCEPPVSSRVLPTPTCKVNMRCDQAVLVAGGWRPEANAVHAEANVRHLHHRLRQLGFQTNNIQTFVTDGQIDLKDTYPGYVHPIGGMKVALRSHLQTLCGEDHCTNALLLYLNNPARLDGQMLLWDSNHDGRVTDDERYSVDELLQDIGGCKARSVLILAEQNFAGDLVSKLQASQRSGDSRFQKVAVLAGSAEYEYAEGGELTSLFTRTDLIKDCLRTVEAKIRDYATVQLGTFFGDSAGQWRTVYNADCDNLANPDNLAGCSTLPSHLWQPSVQNAEASQWK